MPNASEQTALTVSVVIPTYNRAGYLCQALNSVFRQSLPPWEVIVVDDGSTDETADIARSYGLRVRYVRHSQNRGISAARNTGISMARGDIIAWLDSDDLWEPDHLATVISLFLKNDEVDGVYTGLVRIDEKGNVLPQVSCCTVPPEDLSSSLIESCRIQTSTFAVRRRCYDQVGMYDTQFAICEDYDMYIRMAKVCRIIGVPSPSVRYRVHNQNTVGDPVAYLRHRLALTAKHFGEVDDESLNLSDEKRRAHAYAYLAVALKCIEHKQRRKGWRYLSRAVDIQPDLLRRVDTYYELACGDQPTGYRGTADMLDIERNGVQILRWLDSLFAAAPSDIRELRGAAYGNAYLALAMLSDQAGRWGLARRYILHAIQAHPTLVFQFGVARRLMKLFAGRCMVNGLRRLMLRLNC
jgi:glycosyltransferase involved in cell wall biosynthesis